MITSWPLDRSLLELVPFTGFANAGAGGLFGVLVAAMTLVDLAMVLWILLGRQPDLLMRRFGTLASLRRVEIAFVFVCMSFMVRAVLWVGARLSGFAVIAFAWYDLVVVTPVAGVVVLIVARRVDVPRLVRAAAWGSLLLIPAAVYATQIEPYRLVVERADVPLEPARAGGDPVRVGVLADLQTDRVGEHERIAVEQLMAQQPDLIVIPGDLFQGSRGAFDEWSSALRDLLSRLRAPGGVFMVPGDVDLPEQIDAVLEGTEVQLLENTVVRTRLGDRRVTIGGLSTWDGHGLFDVRDQLEGDPDTSDIRLLIAHHGRHVLSLEPDSRVDLVIGGHTHGGQVVLPWIGPPLTLSPLPRRVAAGGLHSLDGRWVYISRGVGHERHFAPRVRWFCPPEVSLLVLD